MPVGDEVIFDLLESTSTVDPRTGRLRPGSKIAAALPPAFKEKIRGLLTEGRSMGFFSGLISGIKKIASPLLSFATGGLLGGVKKVAAAPVARAAVAGAAGGALVGAGGAVLAGAGAGPVVLPAGGGVIGARGNGRFVRSTIVQTTDLTTGAVVRQQTFDGAPYLLNSEVRGLKRVFRKAQALSAKIPRKKAGTPSLATIFKDRVMQEAIANVGCK